MSGFRTLDDIPPLPIWSGILARVVEGREMTFAVVELDANAVAARHQHPNEQIGLVLRGTMTFVIGNETRELRPGDTYLIPGDVPHEATAGPQGAVVIDVFAPIRQDWHRLTPREPRTPVWP
ncbi:MAG TPA: cupin domain-containing protein [Vicinamibacterales bacterium]|nr:cupin domain-containing protein [Vicinamibacterales bacterium]